MTLRNETTAVVAAVVLMAAAFGAAASENVDTLTGTVLDAGGDPVPGAAVSLPELRRETTTDDEGRFAFPDLPAGDYLVSVSSSRSGGAVQRVMAGDGAEPVILTLDKMVHAQGITVTASGVARGLGEVAQPVDVLAGEDLLLRKQSSLGETLAQQPGVTSTSFGQGASRPVIRGLGADRIRILENGLDTGDVSSIGPDHAVSTDVLAAEQIEVVRGPAAVLWGANAIGGVVNVLDGRVPDRPATSPVSGTVELEAGSNADKLAGAAKLDGGTKSFAWHVDVYARDQDDYTSPAPRPVEEDEHHEPGEEEDDHEEEFETGTVENSWAKAQGATIGGSYVTDRGFIGIAFGGYDTEYGIPGHHHHHEEEHEESLKEDHDYEEEEEGIYADLQQRRIDLHGQLDNPFRGFSAVRLSAGWRDYRHDEIEGDELGTRFENEWTEARLDFLNKKILGFDGTLGLQYSHRDFAAAGEEAYVMPTETTRMGAYLFEQTGLGPVDFQFGLRYDEQDTRSSDPDLPDRTFGTWTGSVGVVWDFSEHWGLSATVNRPERAPTPEELYSDGPHAATGAYEIGNPNLDTEVGAGIDLSIRAEYERFEATVSLFATRYDDFIYAVETGEEIDGFEVVQFSQDDAEFSGFEVHGHYEILHGESSHLHLGFSYDQVAAEVRETGEPLPRISPRRGRLALIYMSEKIDARIEGWWVAEQDRVAEHETPTPGYEMLNASFGYRLFAGRTVHELILRGRNLTNESAYNHVSFIKFAAPMPGRDIALIYRLLF